MSALVDSPLFGIGLTLVAWALAVRLWERAGRSPLLTPVLVAIVIVVAVLRLGGIDHRTYLRGGDWISFLLAPATVALAIPIARAALTIRAMALPIVAGVLAGATAAMASAVGVVAVLGGGRELAVTLAPKSATTPISLALSTSFGGIGSLTAVLTVLTGVVGAAVGPTLLSLCRVDDARLRGLALGVSSHGVGTARALQEGPVAGAFSALGMAVCGVTTAILMPVAVAMMG